MINFPNSYDSLTNPTAGQPRNTPGVEETTIISNINDSIEAIETYIGTSSETSISTLTGKVKNLDKLTTKGDLLGFNGTTPIRIPKATNGKLLAYDDTTESGLNAINPTSGGTVTNVSGVTANGFTTTVINPTTTPTITISTNVTGIMKGNGISTSSAIQGTDYYAPGGTDISVSDGGIGVSSLTPFAPIFGGTLSTNPVQQVSVGTVGQALISNGSNALPTFQNISLPTLGIDNISHSDGNHIGFGSPVYSIAIPAGTLTTGRGIRVKGYYNSNFAGFGDYKDDNVINAFIGGTSLSQNILLGIRGLAGTAYGEFEMVIYGVSSTSQRTTASSSYTLGQNYGGRKFYRTTSSIDMSIPQTIDFKFGFEYGTSIVSVLESIIVEKI